MSRATMLGLSEAVQPLPRQEPEQFEFTPEPVPCDDCRYATTCGRRQLACRAFAQYVKHGRWEAPSAFGLPSRRSYRRLFSC